MLKTYLTPCVCEFAVVTKRVEICKISLKCDVVKSKFKNRIVEGMWSDNLDLFSVILQTDMIFV